MYGAYAPTPGKNQAEGKEMRALGSPSLSLGLRTFQKTNKYFQKPKVSKRWTIWVDRGCSDRGHIPQRMSVGWGSHIMLKLASSFPSVSSDYTIPWDIDTILGKGIRNLRETSERLLSGLRSWEDGYAQWQSTSQTPQDPEIPSSGLVLKDVHKGTRMVSQLPQSLTPGSTVVLLQDLRWVNLLTFSHLEGLAESCLCEIPCPRQEEFDITQSF